jgi:hypothetical protein
VFNILLCSGQRTSFRPLHLPNPAFPADDGAVDRDFARRLGCGRESGGVVESEGAGVLECWSVGRSQRAGKRGADKKIGGGGQSNGVNRIGNGRSHVRIRLLVWNVLTESNADSPPAGGYTLRMSSEPLQLKEARAEHHARWEAVEIFKAHELAAMTEERARQIIQSLGAVEGWRERTDWSGLVEQQAIFLRGRRS